jgi:predicted HNH restriction endonuclease
MAIPISIKKRHVDRAIELIKTTGIPKSRKATKFDLVHGAYRFPPKYVLSVAARIATGTFLSAGRFSGGDEANDYLSNLGFGIRRRNEDWTEAECYMAVWLYDRIDQDRKTNKAALYREVAAIVGRTPKSVEWKVENVSACDPRPRRKKPISPAANKQQLLAKVFTHYWSNRAQARQRYAQILQQLSFNADVATARSDPGLSEQLIIEEGAPGFHESFRRKRSKKLLEFARKLFRSRDLGKTLRCKACGFSTPIGVSREIVQLHHTMPISEAGVSGRRASLETLSASLLPLCPTCHAIAHSTKPPMILKAIRFTLLKSGV